MPEVTTLKIPAAHVSAFRDATLSEIASDERWVSDCRAEYEGGMENPENAPTLATADLASSVQALHDSTHVLNQLEPGWDEPEVGAKAAGTLAHIAETMARDAAAALNEAVECSPIDADSLMDVHSLTKRLLWAAEESIRLHRADAQNRGREEAND